MIDDCGAVGGMRIRTGNWSTRRNTAPVPLYPPQIPRSDLGSNPGRRGGKPATNRLSYGTARSLVLVRENLSWKGYGLPISNFPSSLLIIYHADCWNGQGTNPIGLFFSVLLCFFIDGPAEDCGIVSDVWMSFVNVGFHHLNILCHIYAFYNIINYNNNQTYKTCNSHFPVRETNLESPEYKVVVLFTALLYIAVIMKAQHSSFTTQATEKNYLLPQKASVLAYCMQPNSSNQTPLICQRTNWNSERNFKHYLHTYTSLYTYTSLLCLYNRWSKCHGCGANFLSSTATSVSKQVQPCVMRPWFDTPLPTTVLKFQHQQFTTGLSITGEAKNKSLKRITLHSKY
jgi:hypothetical protein